MLLKMLQKNAPASMDRISRLEECFWERSFPMDYVDFQLTINGGTPEHPYFDVDELVMTAKVDYFLGCTLGLTTEDHPMSTDIFCAHDYREFDYTPGHIPIAKCCIKGELVMSLNQNEDNDYGHIYYWDIAHDDMKMFLKNSNAFMIATSFTSLCEVLYK